MPVAGAVPSCSRPLRAVVLAAGRGQRLGGRAKSTLRIDGVSVLERLVMALLSGGAEVVDVVVGPYRDQLRPLIERCGARELRHTLPEPSLADSQRLAVEAHRAQSPGHDLMLTVADLPLLAAQDVAALLDAWRQRGPEVQALMPVVDGVRGHPLLLSAFAVGQVAAQGPGLGVRDWLQRQPRLLAQWVASSPAYVTDLDTPADLQALRARLTGVVVDWPRAR